jgi:hypothetical protein
MVVITAIGLQTMKKDLCFLRVGTVVSFLELVELDKGLIVYPRQLTLEVFKAPINPR